MNADLSFEQTSQICRAASSNCTSGQRSRGMFKVFEQEQYSLDEGQRGIVISLQKLRLNLQKHSKQTPQWHVRWKTNENCLKKHVWSFHYYAVVRVSSDINCSIMLGAASQDKLSTGCCCLDLAMRCRGRFDLDFVLTNIGFPWSSRFWRSCVAAERLAY